VCLYELDGGTNSQTLQDFQQVADAAFRYYRLLFPFVSIVGGFFIHTAFVRWWKMRDDTRVVFGGGMDASMLISAVVPEMRVKEELVRYISAAQALLLWQLRTFIADKDGDGDQDEEDIGIRDEGTGKLITTHTQFLDNLQERGTLTPAERQVIQNAKAPFHMPFQWFLSAVADAAERGDLDEPISSHFLLSHKISKMRGQATHLLMHLSTPIPFSYFYMMRCVTFATVVLTPLAMVALGSTYRAPSYVIEAVGTLLATYFMEIMWVVAISMADPFGFDSCDFPIDKDWNTSEQVMMQQITAPHKTPDIPSLSKGHVEQNAAGLGLIPRCSGWAPDFFEAYTLRNAFFTPHTSPVYSSTPNASMLGDSHYWNDTPIISSYL
jgi:hypothetical protein